jgi:hypothetical protein
MPSNVHGASLRRVYGRLDAAERLAGLLRA